MFDDASILTSSGNSWQDYSTLFGINTNDRSEADFTTISVLPQNDTALLGAFPKSETKVFVQCEKCQVVLQPNYYNLHPEHDRLIVSLHCSGKAVLQNKCNKSSNYIPPGTSLLKKKHQPSKSKKKSSLPPTVPPPLLFVKSVTPLPAATIIPDVQRSIHLGPPELQEKFPPKLSLQQINPKLQSAINFGTTKHKKYKKSAKRSKEELEKIIKTEKPSDEKSINVKTFSTLQNSLDYNNKPKEYKIVIDCTLATENGKDLSTTSLINGSAAAFVQKKIDAQATIGLIRANVDKTVQPTQTTLIPISMIKTEADVENLPVSSSLPMSPMAVMDNLSMKFFQQPVLDVKQLVQPLLHSPPLTAQPQVVPLHSPQNNLQMYKYHPKPLCLTSSATRKIGSAYLLQNQRLDQQRSVIKSIINKRRAETNSCSPMNMYHHRPNILKNSIRNNSLKRAATDKLLLGNNKHIKVI